jgi:hypothetical protein
MWSEEQTNSGPEIIGGIFLDRNREDDEKEDTGPSWRDNAFNEGDVRKIDEDRDSNKDKDSDDDSSNRRR